MIVCIAEKPSVAAEIAKIVGAPIKKEGYYTGMKYQVTWAFGHLCELKSPDEYDTRWKKWDLSLLPMIPSRYGIHLIDNPGIKKQFKIIKSLFDKAEYIINCGDAGQEGELIQRWIMQQAKVKCPVKRLWVSSLTEESIREAFRNLKEQRYYDNLYRAGQARAQGDWLLGMNASRLYTLKYSKFGQILSVGRVQTPTLAMIVDRDRQIEHFVPTPYWVLTSRYRQVEFTCAYGKFEREAEALCCMRAIQNKPFTITHIETKEGTELPPQLYDLTSLQVDCNKHYAMSASQTLKAIQSLYEKKLTTYPRVDTKYLTDDLYSKIPSILRSLKNYQSLTQRILIKPLPKSKRIFDNAKVTDHHAIIPTGVEPKSLNETEGMVYDMICRRIIAAFLPSCYYDTTKVTGKSEEITFNATGKNIKQLGWKELYIHQKEDEEEKTPLLPSFIQGEQGVHYPGITKKMTTPPKRFTEATLLQAMETAGKLVDDETLREAMKANGIGRPSSRAAIIESLHKRGFIRKEKKNLISTEVGRSLLDKITSRLLKSPELTGQWEKKLRQIEAGYYTLESFMKELEQQLQEIIQETPKA